MTNAATPYDQAIAVNAAAVDQCMKLGAVILKPSGVTVGFAAPPQRPNDAGR